VEVLIEYDLTVVDRVPLNWAFVDPQDVRKMRDRRYGQTARNASSTEPPSPAVEVMDTRTFAAAATGAYPHQLAALRHENGAERRRELLHQLHDFLKILTARRTYFWNPARREKHWHERERSTPFLDRVTRTAPARRQCGGCGWFGISRSSGIP
jgi:hypothetical protein